MATRRAACCLSGVRTGTKAAECEWDGTKAFGRAVIILCLTLFVEVFAFNMKACSASSLCFKVKDTADTNATDHNRTSEPPCASPTWVKCFDTSVEHATISVTLLLVLFTIINMGIHHRCYCGEAKGNCIFRSIDGCVHCLFAKAKEERKQPEHTEEKKHDGETERPDEEAVYFYNFEGRVVDSFSKHVMGVDERAEPNAPKYYSMAILWVATAWCLMLSTVGFVSTIVAIPNFDTDLDKIDRGDRMKAVGDLFYYWVPVHTIISMVLITVLIATHLASRPGTSVIPRYSVLLVGALMILSAFAILVLKITKDIPSWEHMWVMSLVCSTIFLVVWIILVYCHPPTGGGSRQSKPNASGDRKDEDLSDKDLESARTEQGTTSGEGSRYSSE